LSRYIRVDNIKRVLCPRFDETVIQSQDATKITFIRKETSPHFLLLWIVGGIQLFYRHISIRSVTENRDLDGRKGGFKGGLVIPIGLRVGPFFGSQRRSRRQE